MNLFNPDKTYEEVWKEAYELRQKMDRVTLANSLASGNKAGDKDTLWKAVSLIDDKGVEILMTGSKPVIIYYRGNSDDDLTNTKSWFVKETQKSSSGKGVDVMLSLSLSSAKDKNGNSVPEKLWNNSGIEITANPKNLPPFLKLGYGVIITKSSQFPGNTVLDPLFIGNTATLHNSAIIYGGIIDDNVSFYKGSVSFDRVIVGKEAMIGAGVKLSRGTILEDGATVRIESRLANDTYVGKEGILAKQTYTTPGMKIPFFAEVGRGKNTPTFSTYFWDGAHGFSDFSFSWKVKK